MSSKKFGIKFYIAFFLMSMVAWIGVRYLIYTFNIPGGFLPLFAGYVAAFSLSYYLAVRFFSG